MILVKFQSTKCVKYFYMYVLYVYVCEAREQIFVEFNNNVGIWRLVLLQG